ncbi:ATP-binding protein [Clostridium oryzae]|uniref:Ferredoxin-3 n=1 Tax=Clostridium oryzae TaxID=1450648 RepID=A0A1V4IXN2_9CLOT|nr:4Fe-4S binding protein [Clostridium oryzae]OPJ64653.1 ferredoxin-3 [Clostridium oryzae]
MIRRIVKIDKNKCNGCGLCVTACQEAAITLIDGKAALLREDYCDGLGNCLPTCPMDAISFEEREAAAYDEVAVKENLKRINKAPLHACPGSAAKKLNPKKAACISVNNKISSELMQWPVQIKLVPLNAPYFDGANLLVAADCTAYAYGNFHSEFMKNRITLIGCPKLDDIDYSEKLCEIIKNNNIKSVTVVRMEVPCCGGLSNAVVTALKNSEKMIPWQVVTISTNGSIKL